MSVTEQRMQQRQGLFWLILLAAIVFFVLFARAAGAAQRPEAGERDCPHEAAAVSRSVPPTCTGEGETARVCAVCGETFTESVPALGHSYGEWRQTKPATWREPGEERRQCGRCGDSQTRTAAKLTHLPPRQCEKGDADMDGSVTAGDARLILRLSVRIDDGLDDEQKTMADFDGKDGVTASDARLTLRLSVGLTVAEPEPPLPDGYSRKGYTANGNVIAEKAGVTYIVSDSGLTLIANKTYSLPSGYAPGGLTAECRAAFRAMRQGAALDGIDLFIVSGYRSYSLQSSLYARYCAQEGKAAADTYSARPGHSEHQSGLAIDLNSLSDSFADTPEGQWLAANAHRYGFIIRYPRDKQQATGYRYEPWHVRFLGKELAASVFASGLCLEEYFGITSFYKEK